MMRMITKPGVRLRSAGSSSLNIMLTKGWGGSMHSFVLISAGWVQNSFRLLLGKGVVQ